MNNEIETIKERLDIAEVVSSYLSLKKSGANLKGLCPFHHEKTPSFMVNPERQIYKCFGCSEGGDIFSFIEKIEGVDFYNALKILADRAGVKLQSRSVTRGDNSYEPDIKTRLYEINELAAKVYYKLLQDHTKAEKARQYIKNRGLSPETITKFRIGFAPDSWDFLIRFITARGYSKEEIFKAGLLVMNNRGDYYDRFRGRIMFPINNVMGSCIGFTSRILIDDKNQAKYINSADSPIYHKGAVIYGLDMAKMAIREQNLAVIVEGNMDVIACHQAGFNNVVAASGTAITEDQIRTISRYTPEIAFAFDADTAGIAAMKRAVSLAIKQDISAKIIEIPAGFKDPDEAIKRDKKIWQKAIEAAKPALEHWTELLMRQYDTSDIANRKKIAKEILPVIKIVYSELEKEHYIKYLAKKLAVSESSLIRDLGKTRADTEKADEEEIAKPQSLNIYQRILGIIWSNPKLAEYIAQNPDHNFGDADEQNKKLLNLALQNKLNKNNLSPDQILILDQCAYSVSVDFQDADSDSLKTELIYLLGRLKSDKYEAEKDEYASKIRAAQESGDSKLAKKLLADFSALLKG